MKKNALTKEFYSLRGIVEKTKEVPIVIGPRTLRFPVPYGFKLIFQQGHLWTVIDNSTGDCFTESFLAKSQAIRYFKGKEIGSFYRGPVIVPRRPKL
jgi:hypothetical protein